MVRMSRRVLLIFWNYKDLSNMEKDIVTRLREFMDNEAKSCSMDFGCITPEYVYRMWGGTVKLEEIEEAMREVNA